MPRENQGVFDDRYRVIPRVLIFITCGTAVLLLKGSPTKRLWANLYNGIGGHIEQGEDVLSAAYRELLEETSISNISIHLAGTIMIDTGENTGIGIYVFRGETPSQVEYESPEGTLEWVEMDELSQIPLVEDLPALMPLVLRSEGNAKLFSGLYRYDENNQLVVRFSSEQDA